MRDDPFGVSLSGNCSLHLQTVKYGQRHAALHDILDCLGEALFRATRDRVPPDDNAYLECLRRK